MSNGFTTPKHWSWVLFEASIWVPNVVVNTAPKNSGQRIPSYPRSHLNRSWWENVPFGSILSQDDFNSFSEPPTIDLPKDKRRDAMGKRGHPFFVESLGTILEPEKKS